jgi:two-component system, cell cycle sensor histidine kinase and response regulator CckA
MNNKMPLELLHLEDNPDDAELIRRYLEKEGLACSIMVVTKGEQFEAALRECKFDVILSDFSVPGYDGSKALETARRLKPEVPFLFVSGTIGEDKAVTTLHSGATDYILKERLDRLAAAILRAVEESSERSLRKKAEAERLELEQRLRQAQKMEAVGQLAGGIAHDFNNLLTIIQGYTEVMLVTETGISSQGKQSLKQVLATSKRASELTRQLLTFSRKQSLAPKLLELNAVVGELLSLLRRVLPSGIELDWDCDCAGALPPVYADRGMIEQVLMNLVINARDAMPNGGRLSLRMRKVEFKESVVLTKARPREGEFVCLEVDDSGQGIAPEDLPRIFEPFFTTKKAGMGTGLGLATVYGIIKQHGGWVEVTSRLGKGACFEVYLPTHTAPEPGLSAEEALPGIAGGSERILLAEDDETMRRFTARVLRNLGYTVLEAETGKAALDCWPAEGEGIDLLLADILLPDGLSGYALADKLRVSRPQLRVILTSGYPQGGIDRVSINGHFLQKPYTPQELGTVVRRSLDEPQAN